MEEGKGLEGGRDNGREQVGKKNKSGGRLWVGEMGEGLERTGEKGNGWVGKKEK